MAKAARWEYFNKQHKLGKTLAKNTEKTKDLNWKKSRRQRKIIIMTLSCSHVISLGTFKAEITQPWP